LVNIVNVAKYEKGINNSINFYYFINILYNCLTACLQLHDYLCVIRINNYFLD
jgi:hypothetical protein